MHKGPSSIHVITHGQLEVLLPSQLAKSFFSPNQDQPMAKFWNYQGW